MQSPWSAALSNRTNLALLAGSVAAGLLAAWWLFPVGLLLWAVLAARIAGDRALRRSYDLHARSGTLSMRFQELYGQVVQSQLRISNSLLGAGGRTRRVLEPVEREIEGVTEKVYLLCRQMTGPENFLKVSKSGDLEGERALLALSIESADDPMIKREKTEMLAAVEARIKKIKRMATFLDRVETLIRSLHTDMEAILVDAVRLQTLPADEARRESESVSAQIRRLADQLDEAVKEVERIV